MAQLYSQFISGQQFTAGAITGSTLGASGLNNITDRLNSITVADNHVTGSLVSGTVTQVTVGDHGGAASPMAVNIVYGTNATPPTASTTTEGALYIQYTA